MRLNKCISCQEKKGTKMAVLSGVAKGVAKLRSMVATATPGHPLAPPLHINYNYLQIFAQFGIKFSCLSSSSMSPIFSLFIMVYEP